jgi:hypothetical protein
MNCKSRVAPDTLLHAIPLCSSVGEVAAASRRFHWDAVGESGHVPQLGGRSMSGASTALDRGEWSASRSSSVIPNSTGRWVNNTRGWTQRIIWLTHVGSRIPVQLQVRRGWFTARL